VQTESRAEHFEVFVVLSGSGHIRSQSSPVAYKSGQCWFLPASLGQFSLQPEQSSSMIRAYVPDLATLGNELRQLGISEAQLGQAIFS
jgi:hypothetical protein